MSCFAAARSGRVNLSDAHLHLYLRRLLYPKRRFRQCSVNREHK